MMDIFNMLGGLGQAQETVSRRLGTSPQQTEAALEAAVPLLLSALTRNAQTPDGAAALASALDQHSGQALDLFSQGQTPDLQEGQQILGHVFGPQQQAAAQAVSRRAGIDPQLAMQLLAMVAPLVLAYLGRRQTGSQSGGIGGILGGILGGGGGPVLPSSPQDSVDQFGHAGTGQMGGNLGGIVGTLNSVLDRDGDGNALNDLIEMFGGRRR